MVMTVDGSNFEKEVLQSTQPVVVDFWAEWCGPCRMLGPVIERLSDKMPQAKFCKLNVDSAVDLAQEYGISSIPAVLVFSKGQVVGQSVGFSPNVEANLKGFLDNLEK